MKVRHEDLTEKEKVINTLNLINVRDYNWSEALSIASYNLIKDDFSFEYINEFVKDVLKCNMQGINPVIKRINVSDVYVNYKRYYTIRDNGRKLKEAQKSTQG